MGLERWGWLSLLVNVVLVSLHGIIALTYGSLAVSAEVIHNLLDLLGAAAVLVGIRLAGRKSRRFPYGLYKVESMVALGLAGLVLPPTRSAGMPCWPPRARFTPSPGCSPCWC